MLKISKSVEYAILSLKYISDNNNFKVNSKTIASELNIPYDLLAKILQKLVKKEIVKSEQGKFGGYTLLVPSKDLTILQIISALDENVKLANCTFENATIEDCSRVKDCCIRNPFLNLQNKINEMFQSITLQELTN